MNRGSVIAPRLWPTETYCCNLCFAPAVNVGGVWQHADPADDDTCCEVTP